MSSDDEMDIEARRMAAGAAACAAQPVLAVPARVEPLTFLAWAQTLTAEDRYDFDSEGRGYKKDSGRMMHLAWKAAQAAQPAPTAAPAELLRALKVIERHSVNTLRTNSKDRGDWAEDMAYVGKVARDALAAAPTAAPAEIERLKALSVTSIMLDVVPGEDGMGQEVYATSVDQMVAKLTELGQALEDAIATPAPKEQA